MINNHRWLVPVVLLAGCSRFHAEPPSGYQGVIELDETVLSFETSGRVRELGAEEGDIVQPDSVVARLDDELVRTVRGSRVLEVEAARAQANLVSAGAKREDLMALEARVRAARATESVLEKNVGRERKLFESNAVPEASLDQLTSELERARAERQSLEAQLSSLQRGARREERAGADARAEVAEAALSLENERLDQHVLRAGRTGRVLDVHVKVGEVVSAGTPVVTLGDTRRPFVEVFVPQGSLAGIHVGRAARVRVDAEQNTFSGKVEHIERRTEFTPRFLFSERERPNLVVRVRVRIDDPGERLHVGVPAFVTLDGTAPAAARR